MKRILAILLTLAVIFSGFSCILVSAASESDVEALVKGAFEAYVTEKGNDTEPDALLAAINTAIAPYVATYDVSDADSQGWFIYHAADGVYDTDVTYPLSIPGHDGYVAALFNIKDSADNTVATVDAVANIPHTDENLGNLTVDVWSETNSNFKWETVSGAKYITAYTGSAEKIVIPSSYTGNIRGAFNANSTGKANVKVVMINGLITVGGSAFNNWPSLCAVDLSGGFTVLNEAAFANNANLVAVKTKNSLYYNGSTAAHMYYRAFADNPKLQNFYPSTPLPNGCFLQGNVFKNTAIRDFYFNQYSSDYANDKAKPTGSEYAFSSPSFSEGIRTVLTNAQHKTATLTRAAVLAQAAADSIAVTADTTADTVLAAITKTYSSKNANITATWTETPVIDTTNMTIDGVVTLSLDGKSIDIDVCNVIVGEETPELDAETIAAIKTAFKTYVDAKGNNAAKDTLVSYINTVLNDATVSVASDDHFFIYHAVDGAYDNATDYPISIPGHDGYISAVFTVSNENGVILGTVGAVEVIPHIEENLGTLTTDVYSADSAVFTTDENGNITGYSGNAEKLVIPASFTGTINLKDAQGKDSVKAIVIGNRTKTYHKVRIANESFKNWGSLRAVVLPIYMKNDNAIGEYAFANNANLKYVDMPHTIQATNSTGYGKFCYGAFQNCVILENAMCSCCGVQPSCTFDKNIYDNTAIRYILAPTYSNGDSRKYLNITKHSYDSGTFVYLSNNSADGTNKKATLTRAATLAKEAANKYAYKDGDTSATVKDAIVAGYTKKTLTSEITADWNDTFTVSNGVASGVLTLTQGDYAVDVEYNYNPYVGLNSLSVDGYEISPKFDPETYNYTLSVLGSVNSVKINVSPILGATLNFASGNYTLAEGENVFTIKATLTSGTVVTYTLTVTRLEVPTEVINGIEKAFKDYVDNKGNNAEPDALLSYINKAIAPAKVEYDTDGFFIRHAVDGVYDENDDGYPIEIKGHDGSVAITLKVYNKDGALVSYYGGLNYIPHNEENLGELTYDIYYYEDAMFGLGDFQIDSDGNIIGYTGSAEKLIIPGDFAGKIAFTADSVPNKDSIKAVVIGGSATASMKLDIANNCFSAWASLRAVELPRQVWGRIGQFAFANNPVLKYVDTPASISGSNGSGYGTFENEAFRDCPVLENINSSNNKGIMTTGQLWKNIYMGTAIRDYIYESYYQMGNGGSTSNIAANPTYKEGTQVILAAGGNGGTLTPTFTRAATMAQEKADTLNVTAENAASALSTITGIYSSKLTGVTAEWTDDYNELVLTYGNYSISVVCNKVSYNTAIGITMNTAADYRFDAPAGIRFSYTVSGLDALLADETVADVKLGTIIAPNDFIIGELSHFEMANSGKGYLDIVATYIKDANTVAAVLSNIKDENISREFSAIGYALITYTDGTSKYVYADNAVTARPMSIALDILANASDLSDEEIAVLESIIDTAAAASQNWIDTAYGSSDAQAMTLRNDIIASKSGDIDNSVYTGETYCINEENFATYKAMLSMIPAGSKVLFERGGTYRVGSIAVPNNNIYFGAYGEGAKPNIYGSEKNFAESVWTNESDNIWSVSDVTVLSDNDAGIVIFDDGKKAGTKRATLAEVTADGDFWYDSANDKVYLYSAVNPNTWNSIEIGVNAYIFEINGKSGISIDNLNIRYTGAHGISIQGGSSDVKITNCEIGYIGGSYMTHTNTPTTRFGNGVEIWCAGSDITVDNCWIHQIYDSGLTHQGTATVKSGELFTQKNITFSNNLIEYCALASIEYWTSASGSGTEYNWFDNINYTGNICRFAGYGFGTQGVARTGYHLYTSKEALNAITADGNLDTFYVSDNIFDTARGGLMQLSGCHYVSALPQLSGNTYIQNNGGVIGVLATQFNNGSTSGTTTYYADSNAQSTITATFKDADGTVVVY